jgi:hypothetical protein
VDVRHHSRYCAVARWYRVTERSLVKYIRWSRTELVLRWKKTWIWTFVVWSRHSEDLRLETLWCRRYLAIERRQSQARPWKRRTLRGTDVVDGKLGPLGGTLWAEAPTRCLRRWCCLAATAVAGENTPTKPTRRQRCGKGSTVGKRRRRCRRRYTVVGLMSVAIGDYHRDAAH